jgi:hypothetical protein
VSSQQPLPDGSRLKGAAPFSYCLSTYEYAFLLFALEKLQGKPGAGKTAEEKA